MQTSPLTEDDPGRLNRQVDAAADIADRLPVSAGRLSPAAAPAKDGVTRTSLTSVQALRGCAMLAVVSHHILYYLIYRLSSWTLDGSVLKRFPVLAEFAFGVDIFFTLSGFLLVLIAKPYLERRRNITNFILHRMLRIWPLYVLVSCYLLARELVSYSVSGGPLPFDLRLERLAGLFFFPSFNERHQFGPIYQPGWTLTFEVWFYACFALALKFSTGRRELLSNVCALVLGGMVVGYNLTDETAVGAFLSDPVSVEFLIGAGICVLLQSGFRIPFSSGLWLLVGLVWLIAFANINAAEGWRLGTRGIPAAFVLIAVLKLEGTAMFPAWLVAVGNASYSIFLTHDLVLGRIGDFMVKLLDGRVPRAVLGESAAILTLVPTVLVGWLVFQVLEKPLNRKTKEWIGS